MRKKAGEKRKGPTDKRVRECCWLEIALAMAFCIRANPMEAKRKYLECEVFYIITCKDITQYKWKFRIEK